ncbi:unknown [Prevotella sp. CAG:5226]|nr:unknown [Prevotella sp. CAG:5226]
MQFVARNSVALYCSISRCSKLFNTISRYHFHIESTFSSTFVSFSLGHIARYDPLRFPRYRGTETLTRRKHLHPDNALSM